jgi:hypothetical protein
LHAPERNGNAQNNNPAINRIDLGEKVRRNKVSNIQIGNLNPSDKIPDSTAISMGSIAQLLDWDCGRPRPLSLTATLSGLRD